MSGSTVVETSASERREQVLRPFLQQIEMLRLAGGELPTTLRLGSHTIDLDPWEASATKRTLPGNGNPGVGRLLLESLALQSKFLAELDALNSDDERSPTIQASLRTRLVTDAAVGLALLEETQTAIDGMILNGRMDQAKKMSGFRAKLSRAVKQIKSSIGPDAFSDAESRAPEMITPYRGLEESDSPEPPPLPTAPAIAAEAHPPEQEAIDSPVAEPAAATVPEPEEELDYPLNEEEAIERRRAILAPFLMQLELLKASGREELLLDTIPGCPNLELDGWERRAIASVLSGDAEAKPWAFLLAEGLAFESMRSATFDQFAQAGSDEEHAHLAEGLVNAGSVGLAVAEELQRSVNEVIGTGDLDTVKHLNVFRNKILKRVHEIESVAGPEGAAEARKRALTLSTLVERRPLSSTVPDAPFFPGHDRGEEAEELRRAVRTAPAGRKDDSPRRVRRLSITLLVLIAAWAVLILPRFAREQLPTLLAQDVPTSSAVLEVSPRPPSMFITVDPEAWNEMSVADRRVFVDKLGQTLRKAGYTGAQIRTVEGSTVAQWMQATGASIYDQSASD